MAWGEPHGPELTERDRTELDWWRRIFACRFTAGNLPKVGLPLYGARFELTVLDPEGPPHRYGGD